MPIQNKSAKPSKKQVEIDNLSLAVLLSLLALILVIVVVAITYYFVAAFDPADFSFNSGNVTENETPSAKVNYPYKQNITVSIEPANDDDTITAPIKNINSQNAALIDLTEGKVIGAKSSSSLIYPASMTKVMTLIIVAENLPNEQALDTLLEIKYTYDGQSGFGFQVGEKVSVRDLIYAAILQSDGVACQTLADYIAGGEKEFVSLMNQKVEALGLLEGDGETTPSTLFQNCTGMHHDYHFTTAYDLGVIMAYAMKNDFCANVLTTVGYKATSNFRDGGPFTFWSNLMHEYLSDGNTQPSTAKIMGGKTGWTGKISGHCIVSYAQGKDGHEYILVTAKALSDTGEGKLRAKEDTLYIYNTYIK